MTTIPKILHYCWFSDDFGGQPWSLLHYVCVKSAVERIRPEVVYFYYNYELSGPWWELTRPLVTPVMISAPREVFGRPLVHPAHRADVVRLRKLIEMGGIYLDVDVLVQRDFDDLLDQSTVLGEEGVGRLAGVGNAVILAEPNAPFLRRWYEEYRSFRSRGHDQFWNEHSILVPKRLAEEHPGEVTVLPYTAFYWPLWTPHHVDWIFKTDTPVATRRYANHLWESHAWHCVEYLTPRDIRRVDTNFNR